MAVAALGIAGGILFTAAMLQSVLSDADCFATIGSSTLWERFVRAIGAKPVMQPDRHPTADVPFAPLAGWLALAAAAFLLAGSGLVRWRTKCSLADSIARLGIAAGLWWMLPGAWELLRIVAFAAGSDAVTAILRDTPQLVLAVSIAGSATTLLVQSQRSTSEDASDRRSLAIVLAAAATYAVVFTAMNWQLYRGLLVPHGDSAMYEEHLWNLTHGKGFRSYLDQGLFLGEHIQVIHALLVPLYLLWPSHLLLELCSSAALASGAIATYFLARRHSGSNRAGVWMAAAYLLAVPMQFLDIAIDLKTFRPTSFVIPLLLFALDQMERGRWKAMLALLAVTLSAQEDLALIVAPLGVWIAVESWRRKANEADAPAEAMRPPRWLGMAIAVGATAYLLLALLVLIPYFRAGAAVHYSSYFGDLGHSPGEIARSLVTQPGAVLGKLFSRRSLMYAVLLLLPYGGMPLRSLSRLLIAAPLFGVLCLMDTTGDPAKQGQEMLLPFHHFHAPLVPILVWAAAAGIGRRIRENPVERTLPQPGEDRNLTISATVVSGTSSEPSAALRRTQFAALCALATGFFFSLSPFGLSFWDGGSRFHWRTLYVPGERAARFLLVQEQIPVTARISSTDFVHPRFTHYERSYDYSAYRRSVAGNRDGVPDDTDYIVIDTQHPYSTIKSPDDVRELIEEPDRWELLPDLTEGYFIVLKSRRPTSNPDPAGLGPLGK